MKKFLPVILFLFLTCIFSFAQTRDVQEIKITSTWGGLGTPQQSELLITHKSKDYYVKGNKIEKRLIDNLLNAIESPEIKQFETRNLGITQEWLNAYAEIAVKEYADYYFSVAAPNQKELYLSSFKNLQFIEKILPSVLSGGWSDDFPHFEVEITEPDASKTIVSSDEQPSFMLPWKIVKNNKTTQTYNAEISRALAALLPKKFVNRDRLSGDNLRRVLAESVMRHIKEDWELLKAENKAGNTLNSLKSSYSIVSAEISPNHGIDFGKEWVNGNSSQTNLHAILIKDSFPKGFAINLRLPFQKEKVENLDLFLNKIDKYKELLFSVDWLKNYIETKGNVQLRFVHNRSFSDKAIQTFTTDMNKIGKSELIAEVEKEQENIALISAGGGLDYYQSYWLVFPSKKVILWRYGYGSLLNWNEKDFETKECSDYTNSVIKCVGASISPSGNITSK